MNKKIIRVKYKYKKISFCSLLYTTYLKEIIIMKVEIDKDKCIACGLCEDISDGLFKEIGRAHV